MERKREMWRRGQELHDPDPCEGSAARGTEQGSVTEGGAVASGIPPFLSTLLCSPLVLP